MHIDSHSKTKNQIIKDTSFPQLEYTSYRDKQTISNVYIEDKYTLSKNVSKEEVKKKIPKPQLNMLT